MRLSDWKSQFLHRTIPALVIATLALTPTAHPQDSATADNVAKVIAITRVDIDALVSAPYTNPIYETGRGDTDGSIYVSEVYTNVQIESVQRPEEFFIFYRDVPTPVTEASAGYSDGNHLAAANQTLTVPVQIIPHGDGVRLFIAAPDIEEPLDSFVLYLRYTMVPSVRFGEVDPLDELHWQLIGNEWNAPIKNFTVTCSIPVLREDPNALDTPSPGPIQFAARFTLGKEKLTVDDETEEHLHQSSESMDADMESAKFNPNRPKISAWMKSSRPLQPDETVSLMLTVPYGLLDPANAAPPPPQGFLASLRMPRLGLPNMGSGGVLLALAIYFSIATTLFLITAGWAFFVKADQPGWASLIPYYNIYIMLVITGKPWWWLLIYILGPGIPVIGQIPFLVVCVLLTIALAQNFGKGTGFTIGLLLLPFIFFPILAFGNAKYQDPSWDGA